MPPPINPALPPHQTSLLSSPKRQYSEVYKPSLPECSGAQESAKRLKTSHSSSNASRGGSDMSKTLGVFSSRAEVIDLTKKPSNFQPHTGAKRLVIKNLRTTDRVDVELFYERTWEQLDAALTAVFDGSKVAASVEVLCRGVEVTCRRNRAPKLAQHLDERCKTYLEKQLLPQILSESGSSNGDALRAVHRHWGAWNEKSKLLRSIFSYLDRSFLLHSKEPQIEDLCINQFRSIVFSKAGKREGSLGARVIAGICELVTYERNNRTEFCDAPLLKESISMLHIFNIYGKVFENQFLQISSEYFEDFAQERSHSSIEDYSLALDKLLAREALRCDAYNLDPITKRILLDEARTILVESRSTLLTDQAGLAKLMGENATASLKILYDLLSKSEIQQQLKGPWETYIKSTGSAIVGDKDKGDEMVLRLLELKRSLDIIIRDSFSKDEEFTYGLREAFGNFINDRKNTSVWGQGQNKVGEMIAKYMDSLLRGGLKQVPRSLISDSIERTEGEMKGHGSTGDEDAELDRQLDNGLELFRFIQGKDTFEAFYKKDLAKRLLMARSASEDAERNMLAKMKAECGHSFTFNLEQMFKDQELARDEMTAYKQSLGDRNSNLLQVSVLSAAAWPTYSDVKVNIPNVVATQIASYDHYYKSKHTGRRLSWKHSLAHAVIRARFKKGPKELLVSAFQAVVLVLFNDVDDGAVLSYTDISAATELPDNELQRTLQSLACGKTRILTKTPKSRDVASTDTFTVNMAFTDPRFKVKVNQIQLKETPAEVQETHERVQRDRQYEMQAAIVRIMKARKKVNHSKLVAEVIEQTKGRGAVEVSEIKKNIEKLIEKDYLERDGTAYSYVA